MRAKRPQFLATRSSRRHRTCSMRTREDHSAIRGTLLRMTAVGATRWPISSTQPHARTPLPRIGFRPGSRAPDVCDLDRKMTALRRLWPAGVRKQRSFATAWRTERKTPHSLLELFIKTALFLKGFFCCIDLEHNSRIIIGRRLRCETRRRRSPAGGIYRVPAAFDALNRRGAM